MFAERDKHFPSRSGQTGLAAAVTYITKPVTKNNFGPSTPFYASPNQYVLPICVPPELKGARSKEGRQDQLSPMAVGRRRSAYSRAAKAAGLLP